MDGKCNLERKTEPKVVVLLSAYNGEKYIREQIESILTQTYQNIRIYVRDDDSKDQTPDILKKYESENKIVLLKVLLGVFFRS